MDSSSFISAIAIEMLLAGIQKFVHQINVA